MVGAGYKYGEHRSSKVVRAMPQVVDGRVDITYRVLCENSVDIRDYK